MRGTDHVCAVGLDDKYIEHGGKGIQEVAWTGAGLIMIKREVVESLLFPWFRHKWMRTDTEAWQTPEDVGFCLYAREHGYKIYLDHSCKINHLPI